MVPSPARGGAPHSCEHPLRDGLPTIPSPSFPLFVLMGGFADNSGITTRLYDTFDKWFRRLPGRARDRDHRGHLGVLGHQRIVGRHVRRVWQDRHSGNEAIQLCAQVCGRHRGGRRDHRFPDTAEHRLRRLRDGDRAVDRQAPDRRHAPRTAPGRFVRRDHPDLGQARPDDCARPARRHDLGRQDARPGGHVGDDARVSHHHRRHVPRLRQPHRGRRDGVHPAPGDHAAAGRAHLAAVRRQPARRPSG